jgi:hypothetical protein
MMIGELTKSYDHSLLINEEQFRNIASFIEDEFVDVEYKIYTSDGADYSLDAMDGVLSYSNPDSRRIIKIVISGNKEHRDRSFYKDFSLSLFDMSKYDKSCILTLDHMEEKDIVFYSHRIDEFVKSAQEPLWWIHKTAVYIVIWVLLYAIAAFFYYSKTDKTQLADKAFNFIFLNGVSVICAVVSAFLIRWVVRKLYPEGGFAIGEQVKCFNRLNKNRNLILITILGTLVLGIISGIITHLIVS